MEGSFADAALNHGFKRARWRRLQNQTIQDLLIASIQNIRILMQYGGRRQAAAMVVALPKPTILGMRYNVLRSVTEQHPHAFTRIIFQGSTNLSG